MAATSANRSGNPAALTAYDVLDQLDGRIDLVLDGGMAGGGIASTVVDCTGPEPILLREGPIPWGDIQETLESNP
jgi:L-threonylcarbamoyladenylate synthase